MADDFGSMVARILTDLNRGSSHATRVKQAIADAIKFYKARRFGFNVKRSEALIQPGDEYVALPTDWIEVDHLRRESDGLNRKGLTEVTYDWIEDNQPGDVRGPPTKFSIEDRELRIFPMADVSYSLMMSFLYEIKNVSVSASDGETNAWMTEGEELIRKHAMGDVLVNYIGDAGVQQGMALLMECSDKIAVALESQAAREQSSGSIRPFL